MIMKKNNTILKENQETNKQINRRDFISKSTLLGAGMAAAPLVFARENHSSTKKPINNPVVREGKRMLGTLEVSPIGLEKR